MKTVDLFSGCGGMSLGFQKAGFDIVAAYENWLPAISTYNKNFSHQVHEFDLSDAAASAVHILENYSPDVIIGGPPCQDFSIANSKKSTARANLTIQFAKIISVVLPGVFVMENVYNIEKSEYLNEAKKIFRGAGYGLTSRVIEASRVGVPQMRKRYFLVGWLDGDDEAFGIDLDKNLSEHRTTVRQYFGRDLDIDFYYAHPRNYNRRAIFSVDEPAATIRRVNRPVPATYVLHPADKVSVTPDLRPLSAIERGQIQTFPKNFKFEGSVSQIEQQIGNAVPVRLAEYVGESITATLNRTFAQ
jgi:DNA (cytosine-5)-methyltransferase 1